MHLQLKEAQSLLDKWKAAKTSLRVTFTRSGTRQEVRGMILSLDGTVVRIAGADSETKIVLAGAEFNGDEAVCGGYLVCEFSNGDRYYFYALKADAVKSAAESIPARGSLA